MTAAADLFLAGTERMEAGDAAAAERALRQALVLDPGMYSAWSNLGVLLACLKRDDEAEQCHRTALALAPAYRKAAFNLAYLLLRQGRYEEGWACFEARDWYDALVAHLPCPRWRGEALAGKALLIGFEAGHGDMIQFCRYAALLKAHGARRVGLLCHPALKALFAQLPGVDDVYAFDAEFPSDPWDCWVPLLSLPYLFGTRLDTIPADLPYLGAAPARCAHWAGRLGPTGDDLRVGLVWKGNPRFENDAHRSLPSLALLAPLGGVPGIRFFGLQKGAGEDQGGFPGLTNLAPSLGDFAETAALIANLDLVISVDTAVAHLAGALGKPCWILLPDFKTDWRWLAVRSDSPWYPGVVRLFRQTRSGDWPDVIAAVVAALHDLQSRRRQDGGRGWRG